MSKFSKDSKPKFGRLSGRHFRAILYAVIVHNGKGFPIYVSKIFEDGVQMSNKITDARIFTDIKQASLLKELIEIFDDYYISALIIEDRTLEFVHNGLKDGLLTDEQAAGYDMFIEFKNN